jgi:hypothetical protein
MELLFATAAWTVRVLEREQSGQTADEIFRAVSAKRTRRVGVLVADAIRGSPGPGATRRDRRFTVAEQHTGSQELGTQHRSQIPQRRQHPRAGDHGIQPDTSAQPVLNRVRIILQQTR